MRARQVTTILLAAVFVAALAGCASNSATSGTGAPISAPGGGGQALSEARPANLGADFSPTKAADAGIIVGTPPSADIERSVSAAYTVPAGSFLSSFSGVIARAVALGGYVVSSTTQPNNSGRIVSGAVTVKIPAARLADFLNGMPTAFVASSINFSAIDHTAQFVDVNARLASAHAHLAALDALLARATSISDITSLEQQIEAVQTEIDTDQGELNVLTASVELATASVRMSERGATIARVTPPNPVSGGISGGWDNAIRVTGAALEGVVSALPLLVLLLAGLLVWRGVSGAPLLRRRPRSAE